WPVNWLSKQFRVGLPELVKAIKRSGKTTKETPTTITPKTTTTTTVTETTTITNNKTRGMKLRGPMLQPQLRAWVMLGICQSVTVATFTTMGNALQSVRSAKELVIGRKTADLGFQQNPNVVTGTFLLNDHYACILFDSGAEKSFVSSAFTPFVDIATTSLNTSYEVELADGMVDPGSLACIKADEKKLNDIRVVRDFPKVFPDDLSGLPHVREIEFRIDLILGALPGVKSPYRLTPSDMLELRTS
nr:reverse transcriptase domain-containing protein [Tanacetum cinerariifolium]